MNADNQPIAVDLAREADFPLGSLRVRPSLRQVEGGAESETLEPRVMQVLVALARRQGEVVSRDELIQSCWGGRIVGEDAISRCIARVRKLGETTGAFSVETIARVGYRLTEAGAGATPVAEASTSKAPEGATPLPSWIVAGVAAVVVVVAGMLLFRGSDPDVDAVVARLTERLQQQNASTQDIQRSVDAAEALGASGRPEERSAFAALASGDSLQAIEVLEDLASKLEARGETVAAAELYTRIGAIALVVDQSRGLYARQKAFELDPASLAAFQGLFFDTAVLKGGEAASAMANNVLKQANLTPRMRSWVLAHTAIVYIDALNSMQDMAAGEAILQQLKQLHDQTGDPVIEVATYWIGSMLAFNRDDLHAARGLAERMLEIWPTLPERLSNSGEVMLVRILYAQGDRERAFTMAADALDRRSRTGDFLPTPVIMLACETGVFTGAVERAAPFCESMSRRFDTTFGAEAKAFSGLAAAADGNLSLAQREFDAGHAVAPPGSALPVRLMFFEAWAAMQARDMDKAERLIREVDERTANSTLAEGYRSFRAHAWWLLGEGFIATGQKSRACAPLAESARLYTEVGGDAGRSAVAALRSAAGCR
jgi:DNA-binding winged helix-turn-helix (wHTH) protein/tetratricopeptide (TPR) repeat protein